MKINKIAYCLIIALPLLALVSASLVRLKDNYALTLFVPCIVALIAIILTKDNIPKSIYPLAIFSIALSLFIHTRATVGSNYLYGGDIQAEYLILNLAMEKGWQQIAGLSSLTSSLSITLVWAGLSQLLHIDPILLYKILSPIILSSIPLMLYFAYSPQIGNKKAFLATMLVTSLMLTFPYNGFRLVTGGFFLALSLLLILTTRLKLAIRIPALAISSIFLILAYYAIALLYCYILVVGCFLILPLRRRAGKQLLLPLRYLALVTVITIAIAYFWFSIPGGGSVKDTISRVGHEQMWRVEQMIETPQTETPQIVEESQTTPAPQDVPEGTATQPDFLNIKTREQGIAIALGLDFGTATPQGKGFRVTQLLIELFIITGFIGAIAKLKTNKWSIELTSFSIAIFSIFLLYIALPFFSGMWGTARLYQISLFILSPFCIMGGETIFRFIPKLKGKATLLVAIVIIVYFLFHSGVVFEVTKSKALNQYDTPSTLILSSHRIDSPHWKESEYKALQWFLETIGEETIYRDSYTGQLFGHLAVDYKIVESLTSDTIVPQGAYIFLREHNTKTGELVYREEDNEWVHYQYGKIPYDDTWQLVHSVGQTSIYKVK